MRDPKEVAERVLARSDQIRRRRRWRGRLLTSIGAAAACLALLFVLKLWMLPGQSASQFAPGYVPKPSQTDTIGPGAASGPQVRFPSQTQSQNETTEPSPPAAQGQGAAAGPFLGVGDPGFPIDDPMELISGYGGGESACYAAPKNGQVGFSMPLRGAMEEYGADRCYRVYVDVFQNGEQQPQDGAWVQGERERLFGLGYIVAYETYFDGEQNHYAFTLHATYDQLVNFPALADYGYFLFLYDERV